MIEWPEQLVKDMARRRAVVMLGSGISKNSIGTNNAQPPTWREFLEAGLNKIDPRPRHVVQALRGGDYLSACEWIKNRLDDQWNPFVIEKFLTPAYKPNIFHEFIFGLDVGIYITPNVDKIFDGYVAERTTGTTSVKTYYDEDVQLFVRNGSRIILKAHGTIDAPDRMIFTRAKYAEARVRYSSFYQLLDALLLTNTFLFLGCGLDDPDFQLLLENFNFRHPMAQPHYIAFGETAHGDLENLVRDTRRLKMLKYSKLNNHKELEQSLQKLVQRVEAERQNMAGSLSW